MWWEILALMISVIIFVRVFKNHTNKLLSSNKKNIPGLKRNHPERGNKDEIEKSKSFGHFLCDLHQRYGPIVSFWEGQHFAVSLASPELFHEIRHLFNIPETNFRELELLIGKEALGLINGEEAKRRRKFYDQYFMMNACKTYSDCFIQIAREYVDTWQALDINSHLPLKATVSQASLAAISRTSFGDYFKNEKNLKRFQELNDYVFLHLIPLPDPQSKTHKNMVKCMKGCYACRVVIKEQKKYDRVFQIKLGTLTHQGNNSCHLKCIECCIISFLTA